MGETDIPSDAVGGLVMDALKAIDVVAYVRYASVYRDFRETSDFAKFLGDEGLNEVIEDPRDIKQGLGEQDISPSDDA